jgi:hypothetical protein
MLKNILLLTLLYSSYANSQTPVALRPDIFISKVTDVKGGATRLVYNRQDSSLYYSTYAGSIYKIIIPASGVAYDTLLYTVADHGLTVIQGMVIFDSTIYVSGNVDPDSALTVGRITGGKLVSGYLRSWSAVAQTVPYETAGVFDHLFSGLGITPSGDTLLQCSGSRGDHGEIESRNGLYPVLRNLPFTSVILTIPAASQNLIIPDDSVSLDTMGLLYARGIRNTYDFAYNANSDLFGCENSGDRDAEDEINLLQKGNHYGFPWIMGGRNNPQQFTWFDPNTDLLINHNSSAWTNNLFSNDSTFPPLPPGLLLSMPCKNTGPDAAFMRDSATGNVYNAALTGDMIYSMTPHRSPLGITIDSDSILGGDYRGNAFVLSYTRGDTSLSSPSPLLSPFNDPAEDLLMLVMQKDAAGDNYTFQSYKIAEKFNHPIDAVLLDTCMYIIEINYGAGQAVWRIDFPRNVVSGIDDPDGYAIKVIAYPNPAGHQITFSFDQGAAAHLYTLYVYDLSGRKIFTGNNINAQSHYNVNTSGYEQGVYSWELSAPGCPPQHGHFVVAR